MKERAAVVDTRSRKPIRHSLADSIYDIVLDRLVDGTFPPNSGINIDLLARELAVSPTPVREALARLESTGLVQREALRGYHAAPLFTSEQLAELMDARIVIEGPVARLASMNADDEFIDALRRNVAEMRELARVPGAHGQHRIVDERFHDLIAHQAGNPFLFRAYRSLEAHVQRFRVFGAIGTSDVELSLAEHAAIAEGFAGGDADRVHSLMVEHLTNASARSVEHLTNASARSGPHRASAL